MPEFHWTYLLFFVRIALLMVFLLSAFTKLNDLPDFQVAIVNFHILPRQLSRPSAYLFLGGEFLVSLFMIIGEPYLLTGFLLAILLLTLFCIAILWVLRKGIHTSCSCFGHSQKNISYAEFWRDIGFLVCALLGIMAISFHSPSAVPLSFGAIGVLGAMAIAFVVLSVHLDEIIELFRYEPKRW